MSVVGGIFPFGCTHVIGSSEDVKPYLLPIRLSRPFLTFDRVPAAEELPAYFDRIVSDVEENYKRANVIPGMDCILTSEVHISFIEMTFYPGLWPPANPQDWWDLLRVVQVPELASFHFDGQYAQEADCRAPMKLV